MKFSPSDFKEFKIEKIKKEEEYNLFDDKFKKTYSCEKVEFILKKEANDNSKFMEKITDDEFTIYNQFLCSDIISILLKSGKKIKEILVPSEYYYTGGNSNDYQKTIKFENGDIQVMIKDDKQELERMRSMQEELNSEDDWGD